MRNRDFIGFKMNLYCISLPNKKKYIGVESPGGNRWHAHCYPSKKSRITYISNAIKKYGKENCRFQYIYKDIDPDWCLKLEKDFIRIWNLTCKENGYNIAEGGLGVKGMKHSQETKKIISEKCRNLWNKPEFRIAVSSKCGKPRTEEWKKQNSLRNKGRKYPPEFGKQIAERQLGVPKSEEQKRKMSESMKRQYAANPDLRKLRTAACHTPEAIEKMKKTIKNKKLLAI